MWGTSLLSPSFPLSLSSRFSGPLAQLGPGKPGGPPCRRFHWSWWLPGRPPTTPAGGSLGPNTELAVGQEQKHQEKLGLKTLKNLSPSFDVVLLGVRNKCGQRVTTERNECHLAVTFQTRSQTDRVSGCQVLRRHQNQELPVGWREECGRTDLKQAASSS